MSPLQTVSNAVREQFGLDPERLCEWRIERAIQTRADATSNETLAGYVVTFEASSTERFALLEDLLVHESRFNRHAQSFVHLRDNIGRQTLPLRVISLGCASGEEPYSIAIALLDSGLSPTEFRIDAVDISANALGRATRARYTESVMRDVPDTVRAQHFERHGDTWQLDAAIVRLVTFHQANVLDKSLPVVGPYDILFCRNLFLYLLQSARQAVAATLRAMLAARGTLYVGQSELLSFERLGFSISDRSGLALDTSRERRLD